MSSSHDAPLWPYVKIALAVVSLLIAGFWVFLLVDEPAETPSADAADARPGMCVRIDGPDAQPVARTLDCADPAATRKVAQALAREQSCPAGEYDELTGATYRLCLTLNARPGDCFTGYYADPATQAAGMAAIRHVDCADPARQVRIAQILDGQANAGACGAQAAVDKPPIVYTDPPLTLCLE